MATKVTMLTQDDKKSYGIKVETSKDVFVIPVLDVRDGIRGQIQEMSKNVNRQKGSRFMPHTFAMGGGCYQNSHKKY